MKLDYIKANGNYYQPVDKSTEIKALHGTSIAPVCLIKKLMFGRWKIDFYDPLECCDGHFDNQIPNTSLILYPSGIQEIRYIVNCK